MKTFKNLILSFFKKFGYEIIGRKKLVKHNSFDAIHIYLIKKLLKINENIIIFDVGANDGGSIERFRNLFLKPIIHSFEPTKILFEKIIENFDLKNLKVNNFALGEKKCKRNFYLYDYHRVNSFYPMENNSKYKIQRTKNLSLNENTKEVEVITIDDYCIEKNISKINLLKIDTQGSEAEVLRGAKKTLNNQIIDIIELEYIFGIAHQNSCSLFEIENALSAHNYKLIAIEKAGNILSFSNYQTNLIYVKETIYQEIKKFHEKNINVKNVTYLV